MSGVHTRSRPQDTWDVGPVAILCRNVTHAETEVGYSNEIYQ